MKIRAGFVSNSSSSSFVMLGAEVNLKINDESKMIKLMNEHNIEYGKYPESDFWDAMCNQRFGGLRYLNEESLIGFMLAEGDNYDGISESSIPDTITLAAEAKRLIKEIFNEDVEIKLLSGQYSC